MKVNGEIFLERFNQYKIKETAILVSGNELSLITKIESLIIKELAGNFVNKKVIFDFKTNKNNNFIDLHYDFKKILFYNTSQYNLL